MCSILNMSEKTLIKSRSDLSDAGLLYFQSTKDKRIGCYYSFTTVISSVYFTDESTDDSTDDSTDETTDDNNGGGEIPPVESPVETSVKCQMDNLPSSVVSSGKCLDETQISPIIDNINIKQEEVSRIRTRAPYPKSLSDLGKRRRCEAFSFTLYFDSIYVGMDGTVKTQNGKES